MLNLSSSGSRGRAGHRRPRGAWLSVRGRGRDARARRADRERGRRASGGLRQPDRGAGDPAQTTRQYVIRFWPRSISYAQQMAIIAAHGADQLLGPTKINPTFHAIVAINDDTIYSFGWVDTWLWPGGPDRSRPPPRRYSVLVARRLRQHHPGEHHDRRRRGPTRWSRRDGKGTLPRGVTKVTVPYPITFCQHPGRQVLHHRQGHDRAGERIPRERAHDHAGEIRGRSQRGAAKILPSSRTFAFSFKAAEDSRGHAHPDRVPALHAAGRG